MIEVVTEEDLNRLGSIRADTPHAKQRAVGVIMEIISRLQRPRAYLSEPTHMAEEDRALLWCVAYDILSVDVRTDAGMSVIEPESLRDIALFCSALEQLTDATDPLWQMLASGKYIDAICIPTDGENSKRHAAMRRTARALGISVFSYKPVYVRGRAAPTPPGT